MNLKIMVIAVRLALRQIGNEWRTRQKGANRG